MSYYSTGYINSNNDMNATGFVGYQLMIVDASSGSISIILPTSGGDGTSYIFIRIDSSSSNTVTFTCQSGDTINNATSIIMPINRYSEIYYWGNNWIFPEYTFTF